MKHFAYLKIEPDFSLADTATILGGILSATFEAETTGRFEEYPAYVAKKDGVELALLGKPEPEFDVREEPGDFFQLMAETESSRYPSSSQLAQELYQKLSVSGKLRSEILE